MDILCYKLALPRPIAFSSDSDPVYLRPLPPGESFAAEHSARCFFAEHGISDTSDEMSASRALIEILSRASGIPARDFETLYPWEVEMLFNAWIGIQSDNDPDFSELAEETRKRVNDTPEIIKDGAIAYRSESLSSFYGKPESSLTWGQAAYYFAMVSAFTEFHAGGKEKMVSKKWLMSKTKSA